MDFKAIASKWQKKWEEDKVFEARPDSRPKFFANAPYPYVNAYPHIGHLFTYMRTEAFARYKRLRGFNVLFPQAWHATGSPIVQAAKRVKDKEPKQLKMMKDMGVSDKELPRFENAEYWIEYFRPRFKENFKLMGMSIDWRREFITTSLNPRYDRFIRWQFRKLKEKEYVIQGEFPVVWDPKENLPVGDHDRVEGEGETPQEFILVKHRLQDGTYLVSATLRQDTILGITNLYVHPEVEYLQIEIESRESGGAKEKWIIGQKAAERLEQQGREFQVTGNVKGIELIGSRTEEVDGHDVLVLPATFIDPDFGTGLVHSVPSDSADDLIALRDLQSDDEIIKKYGLDPDEVKAIEPMPVLDTPGHGGVPAKDMLEKYGVKSQKERKKLEEIKKELYRLSFHTARFNEKYNGIFSRDIGGKKVADEKDFLKEELIRVGWADTYYQLTGKVVSRSLTECIVKIVDDQWFINYNDEEWKEKAHRCLEQLRLYPEKARQQFTNVIDWLHEWACTREEGLGTRLPWDEKWLIESLSDSTIYMSFYTFVHILKDVPDKEIDDNLFDYILLGKDVPVKCGKEKADAMRKEFEYWYPFDFRNSGKDLIQNHLTFMLFNHTAVFPEKHWPKGIGVNGWVTVDGQKMSKSLGNVIPIREMARTYGPDATRLTILSGGEGMDDPNWDSKLVESLPGKFISLFELADRHGKGREDRNQADKWIESRLHRCIKEATEAMDETMFRTAIQSIFFELGSAARNYLTKGEPNRQVISDVIESLIIMLTPFTPHLCEELWERIGKSGYVSLAAWPNFDKNMIDEEAEAAEELAGRVRSDVNHVLQIIGKKKPQRITLHAALEWKYEFAREMKNLLANTRDPKEIINSLMENNRMKKHGKEISMIVPGIVKDPSKLPGTVLSQEKELEKLEAEKNALSQEYGAEVIVGPANSQTEKKSMPGKPGIIVE